MHIFRCAVIVGLGATVEIRLIFFTYVAASLGTISSAAATLASTLGCSTVISTSISEFDEVSSRSLSLISMTSSSMRGKFYVEATTAIRVQCLPNVVICQFLFFFTVFFFLRVCVSGERVCVYVCRTRAVIKSSRISGTFFLFAFHALRIFLNIFLRTQL